MTAKKRCAWLDLSSEIYVDYHDKEWGVPNHNDKVHFEFLILEGAQAGLSWLTVLKRREGYRQSFANFDPSKVAKFTSDKVEELMRFEGIVRHRGKINSAINNARCFLHVQEEFGSFDAYVWKFVGGKPIQSKCQNSFEGPTQTTEATSLSKDLKKRGFTFVGPTIIYAYMQAVGLVNDHPLTCFRHQQIKKLA